VSDGDDELGRLSLQFLLPFLILGQDECEETSDIAAWVRSAAAVLSPCNTAHQLAILLQSRHQADTVAITAGQRTRSQYSCGICMPFTAVQF